MHILLTGGTGLIGQQLCQLMTFGQPMLTKLLAYQPRTAGQQYMHGCVLTWRASGLFLRTRHFFDRSLSDKHRTTCRNEWNHLAQGS